jgi:hypothetical protein
MDFKDREMRFEAEIMLKKICKVNCSVPYPKRMPTLLNDLVQKGKSLQPDCFIRTRVNVENLTVEVHAKTASGWLDLNLKQGIPLNILGGSIDTVSTTGSASAIAISQGAIAMDTGSASQVS